MRRSILLIVAGLAVCGVNIAWADDWKDESGKGRERSGQRVQEQRYPVNDDRGAYFRDRGYSQLRIPPGHYPSPGECRIWYPGRPAGQQPPPGNCGSLSRKVPSGAWLIRHPEDDLEHVHVVVYDERRPGAVLVVGQFNIANGVFVRVVLDR